MKKVILILWVIAITSLLGTFIIEFSNILPTYHPYKSITLNMMTYFVLLLIVITMVLQRYQKSTENTEDQKKHKQTVIYTMISITVLITIVSIWFNTNIKTDYEIPTLQTCDYYDNYSNKIIGGNVEGKCPEITVLENTETTVVIDFSETYEGEVFDEGIFGSNHFVEAEYNRFGTVSITYLDNQIETYEITQSIFITLHYEDKDRYTFETGKLHIENSYDSSFESVRTNYYFKEFLEELPTYSTTKHHDLSGATITTKTIEVESGVLYIDSMITELNPPAITTKEFSEFEGLRLLRRYTSELASDPVSGTKEYNHYINPLTNDIHIEETGVLSSDLYIIKKTSFGYCLENRKDYGYVFTQNLYLVTGETNREYGYLDYERLLYPSGIFVGRVIKDYNPMIDFLIDAQ